MFNNLKKCAKDKLVRTAAFPLYFGKTKLN